MSNISSLGERLKDERQKRGLTQSTMANILGITRSSYSLYESNRREPSLTLLQTMADSLNVTVDYLIGPANIPDYSKVENSNIDMHGEEQNLIANYRSLNKKGKGKLIDYSELLLKDPQLRRTPDHLAVYAAHALADQQPDTADYLTVQAAHERTDIEVTDEMRAHDDAIMNDDSLWE